MIISPGGGITTGSDAREAARRSEPARARRAPTRTDGRHVRRLPPRRPRALGSHRRDPVPRGGWAPPPDPESPDRAGANAPARSARPRFRSDIEGLRGLAVLLVVAFHAGLPRLGGGYVGVDLFFVISGFLITGLLVDELYRQGTVSLTAFYARRVRRLLPMASLVLVVTAVVFARVLAPLDRPLLFGDIGTAALWAANWHFAATATDYMGDVDHSPVLHYWSLSVEEQFYVVWPLILLALAGVWGRRRPRWTLVRRRLILGLALVGVLSLAASAQLTAGTGPWAYFGLHTRAWELAAGGLLALGRDRLGAVPRRLAVLAGWSGLLLVLGSALCLGRDTPFPGLAALWPVGGGVLLVAAGTRTRRGAATLLGSAPLTHLGRLSYSWYLWHWPCLVLACRLATHAEDQDPDLPAPSPGIWPIVLAVVGSLALAVLSHHLVEQRVRRATMLVRYRLVSLALGAGLLAVATTVPAQVLLPTGSPSPGSSFASDSPLGRVTAGSTEQGGAPGTSQGTTGAVTWPEPPPPPALSMTPAEARADDTAPARCFLGFGPNRADPSCRFGDAAGTRVVVLFGDSHAAHWYPALAQAAQDRHWQLYFWAKSGCGYAEAPEWLSSFHRYYTECDAWRSSVLQQIGRLPRIDAVVIGRSFNQLSKLRTDDGGTPTLDEAQARWREGAVQVLDTLRPLTGRTVLLRDIPRPGFDVPACLSEHPDDPTACQYLRAGHTNRDADLFAAEQPVLAEAGVRVLDLGDLVCGSDPCPVVSPRGTILFRDAHHLTATFAAELASAVAARLAPLVDVG